MAGKKKTKSTDKPDPKILEKMQEQIQQYEAEIQNLKEESNQSRDQALRALAELENFRKRAERERQEQSRYGATALAREIIPVADNLTRALAQPPITQDQATQNGMDQTMVENVLNFIQGIQMTEKMLQEAFQRQSIIRYDSYGEIFNPNWHEVMTKISDTERPAGEIVQVFQYGYRLHDRVLQAARVAVADGNDVPAQPSQSQQNEAEENTATKK
ncbi:MAG: nucleotide exchange factor GrpE [Pseudomonadota bacterium]